MVPGIFGGAIARQQNVAFGGRAIASRLFTLVISFLRGVAPGPHQRDRVPLDSRFGGLVIVLHIEILAKLLAGHGLHDFNAFTTEDR